MTDRTGSHVPLAALAAHLSARRLEVALTAKGLRVTNPEVRGCCAEVRHASDMITCRRHWENSGRAWFFTSWGEPIAPADEPHDAALHILDYLSRQPRRTGASQ